MKEKFSTDFSIKYEVKEVNKKWQMKDVHFHDVFEVYYSLTDNIKYFSHKIQLNQKQSQKILSLFDKGKTYNDNKPNCYGKDIYRKIILGEILLLINSFYHNSSYKMVTTNDSNYNRIKPVLKYIHNNYNKNLSRSILADEFNFSSYHLGDLFKKATGFSLYDYIINLRIMKAKELLLKEDTNVSKVCELVGFGSYSHFIRSFKKRVGISPGKYSSKNQ